MHMHVSGDKQAIHASIMASCRARESSNRTTVLTANGVMPVALEILVHFPARHDALIPCGIVHAVSTQIKLVPVEDAAGKGTDEVRAVLGARHGLDDAENQRQIAPHAVLRFQNVRRLNALPRGGQFDEDAFLRDRHGLVQVNDAQRALHRRVRVERKPGIDFGANVARHELGNGPAQIHRQPVHGERHRRGFIVVVVVRLLHGVRHGVVDHGRVEGIAAQTGLRDKEGIGGGVGNVTGRGVVLHDLQIATVNREDRHGGELRQLGIWGCRYGGGREDCAAGWRTRPMRLGDAGAGLLLWWWW